MRPRIVILGVLVASRAPGGLSPVPAAVHGGRQLTHDPVTGYLNVPRRELVSAAQVLLQTERLKFAAGLPEVETLTIKLPSFEVKITENGQDPYSAWRD